MNQTDNEPQIVHVWICVVRGTEREICARVTRNRAEQWVEESVGGDSEWIKSHGPKDLYRASGEVSKNGMVALAPLPDRQGMIVSEV